MKANKDRLETLEDGGKALSESYSHRKDEIEQKLAELRLQWSELDKFTIIKEKKMFDANKADLFNQVNIVFVIWLFGVMLIANLSKH